MDYDAELQRHNEVLRRSLGIRRDDRILDIGCGTGQTTRDAARVADAGAVVGIDVSAPMIARARRLTEAEHLPNVRFEQGDAGSHPFPAGHFDVAISRFGTMFFADAVAAFRNIARALKPGGRLVMMVWREHDRNEWSAAIERALSDGSEFPAAPAALPDPFSLADPTVTERILERAGFIDVTFDDVHEPVYYGPDVAAALDWILGFVSVNEAVQRLDAASAERALARLRQVVAAHRGEAGVWFDSRAWVVHAVRP